METFNPVIFLMALISYLLGAIPTAYLIARFKRVDIFSVGSGNMGAANVQRSLGMRWGITVMLIDMFKGSLAIFIAQQLLPENIALATTVSAIAAILGHNWSIFATMLTGTLRGGKGASTAFGTLLMVTPLYVTLAIVVLGVLAVLRTRYVSFSVLLTLYAGIAWMLFMILRQRLDAVLLIYSVVMGVLLFLRFRENIRRLLDGTERRIGERV